MKVRLGNTPVLAKPVLGKRPEAFNAIDPNLWVYPFLLIALRDSHE